MSGTEAQPASCLMCTVFYREGRGSGLDFDSSPVYNVEIKNEWSYEYTAIHFTFCGHAAVGELG